MGKIGKIIGGVAAGVGGLIAAGAAIDAVAKHNKQKRNDDDDYEDDDEEEEVDKQGEKLEKLSATPELEASVGGMMSVLPLAFVMFAVGVCIEVYLEHRSKFVMTVVICSLALLVIGAAAFFIGLLIYKNKTNAVQEKINELKSETRIAKARYVQRTNKTLELTKEVNESQGKALREANKGGVNFMGAGHINDNYKESIKFSKDLFNNLNLYQKALTIVIKKYNVFIKKFPNSIYSHMLKLKPESYVANDTLDKSLDIGQDEF